LRTFEDAVAFCDERGLVEVSGVLNASIPGLLIELGRVDEALTLSKRLASRFEGRSVTQLAVEVEAVELHARVARGDEGLGESAEQLVSRAKLALVADLEPYAVASAAAAFAVDAPERLVAVLTDLERSEGASGSPYYARCLPRMVRCALAVGRRDLAERLLSRLTSRYPLAEHTTCAAHAALAEDVSDYDGAAALYAEAAERWRQFGNVPEHAYALLGQGRCLRAAGPLHEARELFASMGYAPALAEVDALLAQTATAVP
jgi:tetratricopeptide (TPR) repeat protein